MPGIVNPNDATDAQRLRTGFGIMVATNHSASQGNNGFSAGVDGSAARRQLRMSVGVVVMLSIGIVSAAVTVGPHPMAAKRDIVSSKPVTMLHADAEVIGARPI